jgi:1-acyl-sn-glycerol-3-phosphate acyltransferase
MSGPPAPVEDIAVSARVRGLVIAAYTGLSVVFFCLVQLPVMLVTFSGDFSIWLARRMWSTSALWLAGVRVEVVAPRGLPAGPAIYASNHESALDVWALLRSIPRNVRFIAKQELFRIPVFGWYLRMARFVSVDRRNHARAVASLKKAAEIVRSGISLIVFPEGTRSGDGRIQPFKKGPFVVAMEADVPVVPIAIAGAAELNPKGKLVIRPGTIRIGVGEPVMPHDFADKAALLREVRRRVIALHLELGGRGGDLDEAVAARGVEGASS